MKTCCRCKTEKELNEFVKSSRSKDGFSNRCKHCHRIASIKSCRDNPDGRKESYQKYYETHKQEHMKRCVSWAKRNPQKVREIKLRCFKNMTEDQIERLNQHRRKSTIQQRQKFPDKYKARSKVNNAIAKNKIPKASTLQCINCGNQAQQYHHHNGYNIEHWLDVVPMCIPCHSLEV